MWDPHVALSLECCVLRLAFMDGDALVTLDMSRNTTTNTNR